MTTKPILRRMLIRCPRLSLCSPIASSIVEQGILEIARGNSIMEIEVDRVYWHDYEWCWIKVNDFLSSPWDFLRLSPTDFDNLERECFRYCDEVEEWMRHLVKTNRDALEDIRHNFQVHDIRVVRRLPELWIIELRGFKK